MVKYKLVLGIIDILDEYTYEIELKTEQRNNPLIFFTPQRRQEMRRVLEGKSECKISDESLDQIIKTWLLDIQEDYRETLVVLNLPSLLLNNISNLQEQGYQSVPEIRPPIIADIEPALGMSPPLNFC
jgi:hypothetical protein